MNPLWDAANFVRVLRTRMRFGELSRAPLHLLRLQLQGETAECDWMARAPDPWDADLLTGVGERNASSQALLDSMAVREQLFETLTDIRHADFRVFRQWARESPELIITGRVTREDPAVLRVTSPVMRAKLLGFHFSLIDGVLVPLQVEERDLELITIK
jgi:hypothetical protein